MNWWMCQSVFQAAEKMNEVITVIFFFGEEQHILFPQIIDMSNMRPEFKYAKEEFRVTISCIQCFISLKMLMN